MDMIKVRIESKDFRCEASDLTVGEYFTVGGHNDPRVFVLTRYRVNSVDGMMTMAVAADGHHIFLSPFDSVIPLMFSHVDTDGTLVFRKECDYFNLKEVG